VLASFHRRYPAVNLTLRTATTAELAAAVLEGALDGAFVTSPIDHAELTGVTAFQEELVLIAARRFDSLAALRAGTPESGPTALVFRVGCTYRHRLENLFATLGWPSAARWELGTLDGMIGCVAAGMGVAMLPRALVERSELAKQVSIVALDSEFAHIETLFIHRRSLHRSSALAAFISCLGEHEQEIAA
jgi:LysR family transcriptional regulator, cell division regulator